jgi:hypothetical protein
MYAQMTIPAKFKQPIISGTYNFFCMAWILPLIISENVPNFCIPLQKNIEDAS